MKIEPVKFLKEHARQTHLALLWVWIVLAVPTLLWWKSSIAWVALMSLYANLAGHWAGWSAER